MAEPVLSRLLSDFETKLDLRDQNENLYGAISRISLPTE